MSEGFSNPGDYDLTHTHQVCENLVQSYRVVDTCPTGQIRDIAISNMIILTISYIRCNGSLRDSPHPLHMYVCM